MNYLKLEQILEELGYSQDQIAEFRGKFNQVFFEKIGRRVEGLLNAEQRRRFSELAQDKNTTIGNLAAYFKTLGIEQQVRHINQEVFEEATLDTLQKMSERASHEQLQIIKRVLTDSL
jgi:hypothetical protein